MVLKNIQNDRKCPFERACSLSEKLNSNIENCNMQQNMIGNIAMRDDDVNTNQRPEHLSIEIPQKKYKKPVLVEVSDVETNKQYSTHIATKSMIREDTDVEIKNKQIDSGCIGFTISLLICIGIGILCICIAFQHNESDDGKSLKLSGNIVLVMYLGIGIIGCILICIIGALFAQICSCCCEFYAVGLAS